MLGEKLMSNSPKTPAAMENHKERPEIIEAFNGNTGSSIRYSSTLKSDLMYIAIPWPEAGTNPPVILRCAVPLYDIDKPFGSIYVTLIIGGALIILLAGGISLLISQRIYRPINAIK